MHVENAVIFQECIIKDHLQLSTELVEEFFFYDSGKVNSGSFAFDHIESDVYIGVDLLYGYSQVLEVVLVSISMLPSQIMEHFLC